MKYIDGKKISNNLIEKFKNKLNNIDKKLGLKVISVGNDISSDIYINNKKKICNKLNINFYLTKFDNNINENEIINEIIKSNNDANIDGIILQLPLPNNLDKNKLASIISPNKDIDCFNPINIGNMVLNRSNLKPCTPAGIIHLLNEYDIKIKGSDILVIGRSDLLGKPLANILINMGATVQIANSNTIDLDDKISRADIIISATGKYGIISNKNIFKKNVCIIDVGINKIDNKIYGDVNLESLIDNKEIEYITPVPGGVGPMTIAYLINNLILCYENGIINN